MGFMYETDVLPLKIAIISKAMTKKQRHKRMRLADIITAKIDYFADKMFCGFFTPQEIIELVKAGVKPKYESGYGSLEWVQQKKREGKSNQICFYFYLK